MFLFRTVLPNHIILLTIQSNYKYSLQEKSKKFNLLPYKANKIREYQI